jgi:hypothetical protein
MKAIYDNIQIEGTLEEIAYIFDKIRSSSSDNVLPKVISSATSKTLSSDNVMPKVISSVISDNSKFNNLKEKLSDKNDIDSLLVENFIRAL